MKQGQVKRSMATGSIWMIAFNMSNRFLGIISTMILARILVPEDYGLIAMAMSFYAMIEILTAFGFDMALIQKSDLDKQDFDTVWTIRLICYFSIGIAFFFSAPYIAEFYDEPRLTNIARSLCIAMFLSGIENIKLVEFRRELQFNKEFNYQVSVKLVGFFVTIPMALYWENYWALVIGQISSRVGAVLIGYYMKPYRPNLCLAKASEIMSFSSWILLTNLLNYVNLKLPDLILGKLMGSKTIGLYNISNELSNYSATMIGAPMNRAVYSGYSKMKDDLAALSKSYLQVVGIQALIILPLGFGLSATSEYVVNIILGDKWLDAIGIIKILALSGMMAGITSNAVYIYMALGKPRFSFYLNLVKISVLVPTFIYSTAHYGIVGAAWTTVGVGVLAFSLNTLTASKMLKINTFEIYRQVIRSFLSALVMFYILTLPTTQLALESVNYSIAKLVVATLLGVAIYAISILLLWYASGKPDSSERYILEQLRNLYMKRFNPQKKNT